ncbi:MAG TPA: FlgD immunoglobulin-like domain containing protein, partial [Candidatus Wallbacteria bacterium]|nr:FlgD immunoglobulin-like domain containing protein [Candidatus Wallbacteria bacterium]
MELKSYKNTCTAMAVALILMFTACGALASGNPSAMPPYTAPIDGTYYKDSNAVQLQWLVPTDTENDTVEMKVVFFGPQNNTPGPINPNTTLGASSEVTALKPMFSITTPVSTNPAGVTPPGTPVTFQVLPVLPANLTEGKWWWDVYTWDGTSYSSPQRTPRSFVLDYTAPKVTNMSASNLKFSTSSNAVKKDTTLSYNLSETSDVTIEVLNSANLVIAQLENGTRHDITATPNPQTATWNGVGASSDGKYTIRVRAVDLAGNSSVEQSVTVEVVNTPPGVSYVIPGISPTPFSPLPASPGIKDIATVTYSVSDTSEVGAVIYPQGTPANIKKVLIPKTSVIPSTNFSQWDGTEDVTGNTCADGIYIVAITATNEVGLATTATRNVTIDTTPPTVNPLTITPSPFSPNSSSTTISYTLNESATVEIIIKNQARTTTIRTLQAKALIAAGIQQIQWDGRDSGGAIVTDGIYAVEINAEDGAGNTSTTVGNVRTDTQIPIIGPCSVTPVAISPNGDGVTDTSTISYTISQSGTVEIRIISTTGPQVRQFITQHASAGTYTKDWDGRDSLGNVVSEGDYKIELYLTSSAGTIGSPNPATLSISVDITPPTISQVTVVPSYFSPGNSTGIFDTATLNYNISETSAITIKVLDIANQQIKILTNNITQASGLHNIVWDGKDDTGKLVANGIYHFEIGATDPALNKTTIPQYAPLPIIPAPLVQIDNDGPVINILSATTPFAPNSQDSTKRITTVTYQITDAITNPALCTAEILVKTKVGALVRTLIASSQIATGAISTITWDGKNTLGQIVDDGTYAVYINAIDPAGNPSLEASVEVNLQNKGPNISSIRYRNNRNTIDTDDTIEITFDRAINDSALNGVNVTTVFAVIGTGTFGSGAILDTGVTANDNILEIRLGNGYIKFKENADTLYILTTTDRIRSYLTGVVSTDNVPHLVLDGSPPYLLSSSYVDIGNDGMNKGDQILLTFNENVSIANNSPSAVQVLPPGKGYNIGGGANLSNGGTATQIVVTMGDIDTTSIYIPGVYDPTKTVFLATEKIPTGINVVANQNSIVDTAGNFATPNLNVAAQPLPGVDIGSSDSTRPKVVYAKYSDAYTQLDKGGLSSGDMIYVGFDKAILVDATQAANTDLIFRLPVSGNAFGFGATFKYTGVKEIAITLGGVNAADVQPKITVKGTYLLGNNEAKNAKGIDNPSGLDITTDISTIFQNSNTYPITDLAGNLVIASGIPVDIGSVDTTAPQILVAKFTSEPNVGDNLINPSPDSGFKLIAITDDTTLKGGATGDVKIDISSIYPDLTSLVLSNKEGNTFKTDLLQTPSGITGSKTFTVTAEDFSGNVSQPYTFTAYVVEPASEVKGEINPSSVTKKTDPLALPEEFVLTLLPKIESYNVGIDQIIVQHPGGGYTYSTDTIDVYIGTKKLEQTTDYTYTKTESGSLFTITLTAAAKVLPTTTNQKITVKFKMNVPTLPNSPAGTYFSAWVTDTAFSKQQTSPYKQVATPANVDDNSENNNKFKVVVSDIGIDSVITKLDYSEFFWRINFEVKFSKELSTAVNPTCFYQPQNIVPALGEIPIQFVKFENKIDTTSAGNPVKAVYTGYARVPIDNANYLNSFTFIAKGFYDTENVLIAKVYKKDLSMSTGFITTAFS